MEIKYTRNDGYVILLEIRKINNFIKDNVFVCFTGYNPGIFYCREGEVHGMVLAL